MGEYIGEKITKLRKIYNLTQKDIAKKLCVSDKTVSKWECYNAIPDIEMIKKLSSIFNISIEDFMSDKPIVEIILKQNNNILEDKKQNVEMENKIQEIKIIESNEILNDISSSKNILNNENHLIENNNIDTESNIQITENNDTEQEIQKFEIESTIKQDSKEDNLIKQSNQEFEECKTIDKSEKITNSKNCPSNTLTTKKLKTKIKLFLSILSIIICLIFIYVCFYCLFRYLNTKNDEYNNKYNKQQVEQNNEQNEKLFIYSNIFNINYDEKLLYIEVSNATDNISLTDSIVSNSAYNYNLFEDENCKNIINKNSINLNCGDNILYVKFFNSKDSYIYKINIKRKNIFNISFVTNCETQIDSFQVEEGNIIEPPTQILKKNGYIFDGWDYDFDKIIKSNLTIEAKFSAIKYKAKFLIDEKILTEKEFTIEDSSFEQLPTIPEKVGYTSKWEDFSLNGKFNDFEINAIYSPINYSITYKNTFNLQNNNPDSYIIESDTFELKNLEKENYIFDGWYSDENFKNKITEIKKGSFGNLILYAKWTSLLYEMLDDGTINFGLYPQTNVDDSNLLSQLNSTAGMLPTTECNQGWTSYNYNNNEPYNVDYMWYKDVEYEDIKYRGVYFTRYRYSTIDYKAKNQEYQESNSYYINEVYWFKFEPLNWKILQKDENTIFLMCNSIIDSQLFSDVQYYSEIKMTENSRIYSNDYVESYIRNWLNNTFYDTAFSEIQKQIIKISTIDVDFLRDDQNVSGKKNLISDTINDKIFLLSKEEVTNEDYGFNKNATYFDNERQLEASDYAKSQGYHSQQLSERCGSWYLRSVYTETDINSQYSFSGSVGGMLGVCDVNSTYNGIVPALKITIE